jgi:predicted DNA-binding transcriptional regulator YafY
MTATNSSGAPRVHARALSRIKLLHDEIGSGRCPNNADLARKAERSVRTIIRDLEFMRDQLGAPLHYDPKERGWRYLKPGWALPAARLTEGELLAFFVAEHALKLTGHKPEAALLRAGLSKLAAHLPEEVSVNLGNLGEALSVQQAPHVTVEPETLRTLARAAGERRTVAFDYHAQHSNRDGRREADVLLLHNFAGDWYAIAYDHLRRDLRDFHVGRIKRLALTDRYFDPPPGWDADGYLRRGFYMMRGGRTTTVGIVFDPYQARWMRERGGFHPDERREQLPDGSLRLTFPVGRNGLDAVARFCLTYAGHCRAERPAALRRIIRDRLARALEQHGEG